MDWEDLLLEHNRRPRNRGPLAGATHRGFARNPDCGDEVTVELRATGDGHVEAAGFQAQACAICTAAASMLTARVRGVRIDELDTQLSAIAAALAGPADAPAPAALEGDLEALAGVRRFPVRIVCAQLPFRAARTALATPLSGSGAAGSR
jgi:nitrogen fixation protein NifU and related proteins